jgi:hypothetical protein
MPLRQLEHRAVGHRLEPIHDAVLQPLGLCPVSHGVLLAGELLCVCRRSVVGAWGGCDVWACHFAYRV